MPRHLDLALLAYRGPTAWFRWVGLMREKLGDTVILISVAEAEEPGAGGGLAGAKGARKR